MKWQEVLDPRKWDEVTDATVLGVDIGSRNAKAVVIHGEQIYVSLKATGVSTRQTLAVLLDDLLGKSGLTLPQVEYAVGTGYGRVAIQVEGVPTEILTEITCHALGAHFLEAETRTIIDIGGQDAKGIQVDPRNGSVVQFRMNDKCAAGTGRFLEKAANLLGLPVAELGPTALRTTKDLEVSRQCVVFAESEVVSLRAKGEASADIAAGVHLASAKRVISLLNRIPQEEAIVFTGGVSNNVGMRHALETLLQKSIANPRLDMVYAGALGAALHAQKNLQKQRSRACATQEHRPVDMDFVSRHVVDAETSLIARTDVPKVGYLCSYTPVEILDAAGVAHTRLAKCGTPEQVARGEAYTKSVFCDVTKSILGSFAVKDPLFDGLDRVTTFYTCDSMRAAADAIDARFKPTYGYLVPRNRSKQSARQLFRSEIVRFRKDVEDLVRKDISLERIRQAQAESNRIRALVREISEFRKLDTPALTGTEFLEIVRAIRSMPYAEQIPFLGRIREQLAGYKDHKGDHLRILLSGGLVADGDRRLMSLIEVDMGARVVAEDHCTGISSYYRKTPTTDDPFADLAAAYLDQAPCARQNPISERVDFSLELARDYRADAVVYAYLKFCPCYGMTKAIYFDRLKDLGIPVLELDLDYSKNDVGQIKTRLEAFFEVARKNKELHHA
jgi:predicted CoA-substrate-specific enzyme activase